MSHEKMKFLGSAKCPQCGHVWAVYLKKKTLKEPEKGEYEEELIIK